MQYKNLLLFFLIQIFCAFSINAQNLDSLLLELKNYKKDDTVKVNLLNAVAKGYRNINPDNGLETSNTAIALAKKLNWQPGLAVALCRKGQNLYAKGQLASAIESCNEALAIATETENNEIISLCYNDLGAYSMATGNLSRALEYFQKALSINEQLSNETRSGILLGNIGAVYEELSDYPKALEYLQRAFDIHKKLGDQQNMAGNIGNIGLINMWLMNYAKAEECFLTALSINEKTGNKSHASDDHNFLGMLYGNLGQVQKSLECFKRSLAINEELGDKMGTSIALGNIGNAYESLYDYPRALEYLQKALRISEEINRKKGLATSFGSIGSIYQKMGDNKLAIEYHKKALALNTEMGNRNYMAANLTNIGVAYDDLLEFSKSIEYYQRAVKINDELRIDNGPIFINIGAAYNGMGEYEKAFEYFQKTISIGEESENNSITAFAFGGLGIAYLNMSDSSLIKIGVAPTERYTKTLNYLQQSLDSAKEYGMLEVQRSAWESLSTLYEKQMDYTKSLEAYKNFINVRDSIVNDKKGKEIARLEVQYEFNKKEDSLKFQQQITDGKLHQQVLIAKQQDQQLALNKNQLVLSNKEKDLQRLAYLKTQADLQNEQLLKQEKEKQLTLVEKEKQLQTVQVTTLSQENDLNKLKRRQQWFYSIGILILLGLFASYFFYLNRLKQGKLKMELAKEKAEQEKKEAEFQRNLADVSLTALRSQMNPHFIFNCLNSIKLYTTQNDTASATEYLTKFSRLIRLVMENSRNDRISLTAELDALRLYIEMEAMRFKEKLSYTISVDKDVEMDYIEIPPLLLQPYVENAVWHGLMHKEKGGHIDISAAMKKNESLLEINITDNGVGRAKAEELRSKTATKHKSYGMKVTSERIALINQIYKTGANVVIHDVTNGKGEIAGTRVVIQIPV